MLGVSRSSGYELFNFARAWLAQALSAHGEPFAETLATEDLSADGG